jgi:ubiquinone/menaquinone biosynthesis C-methylase UbiE
MKKPQPTDKTCSESEVFEEVLSLDGKEILELGCGRADITRLIAKNGHGRKITATEVDEIQHSKNILIDDLPNVTFLLAGSEAIPSGDESFDIVFMFKSFHHVPLELMGKALNEAKRVLRPGGMVYISEPVFEGAFNEILRLFNNEKEVREAAYRAIKESINNNDLILVDEIFFNTPMIYESFEEFEERVINVTHTDHRLSPELYQRVKDQFLLNIQDGAARFLMPIRVNLLQKISKSYTETIT